MKICVAFRRIARSVLSGTMEFILIVINLLFIQRKKREFLNKVKCAEPLKLILTTLKHICEFLFTVWLLC